MPNDALDEALDECGEDIMTSFMEVMNSDQKPNCLITYIDSDGETICLYHNDPVAANNEYQDLLSDPRAREVKLWTNSNDKLVNANTVLKEALRNVMGFLDNPVARRKLNIDPNDPNNIWLLEARKLIRD